jgi:putative aldouronate transport system substrate-binding protein
MKRSVLKRIFLVLTGIVLSSNLVACSTKNAEVKNTASTKEVVKPQVITGMFDTILKPEDGQDKVFEEYKKQTGIELKVTNPVHNQYYEKLGLTFASGDIPDVIEIGSSTYVSYATNGALYDMTSLVDKSSIMKKIPSIYKDAEKVDGKMYGFPKASGNGTVTYMRKDWLDANNLQIPKNYDEYINVLKVFSDDPDKNGKKDTFGTSAAGLFSDDPTTTVDIYLREFYQDAYPDFKLVNNKWVDGMLQPEMKPALERLKKAYDMGLFDKEIISNKTTSVRDKWYAGKVGAISYWAGTWNTNLENDLKKAFPTASVVAIPAIKEIQYTQRVPSVYAITSSCKNPEGVFKYLIEYMHDGDKGEMLFSRGVENVHYKVSDGKTTMLPLLSNPAALFNSSFFDPALTISEFKDPVALDPRVISSTKILNENPRMAMLVPPSDSYSKNGTDLTLSRKEIISKIVIGQMTVDEGLDKYKKTNQSMIDEILKEFNKSK